VAEPLALPAGKPGLRHTTSRKETVARFILAAVVVAIIMTILAILLWFLSEHSDARKDGPGIEDTNGKTVDFETYQGPLPKKLNGLLPGFYDSTHKIDESKEPDTAMIVANDRARRWLRQSMNGLIIVGVGLMCGAAIFGTVAVWTVHS
jgi:hypothetical protein